MSSPKITKANPLFPLKINKNYRDREKGIQEIQGMLRQHVTFVECFRKPYCNVTYIFGDLDCIVVMFDIVQRQC